MTSTRVPHSRIPQTDDQLHQAGVYTPQPWHYDAETARRNLMSPERIFVIDDNPNDILLMRRLLERAGYSVDSATSGEEALIRLAADPPHCVMVDFRMPGMDGYQVCRSIKLDAALQNIPVLMLTGADSTRNLVEGLDAGADDYVTKSSEIEVILARVRALLRVKAYQDRIVEQTEQLRTLYEEVTVLNERFNKDLQFARRVQESLLPLPEFSNSQVEIRSTYIPSDTLSGDFYDYFLSNERLYLFVADVSGHGLPAAILTSLLKSYLHSEAGDAPSLASFMASLNDFLVSASLPSQYATALLVQLNREKTEIQFANAAHPPFLLYRSGQAKATQHEQPSHFLGAMPGMKYEQQRLSIKSGDVLFAYTDGLTDRRTAEGEFYAIDRVASIIERAGGAGIASLYDLIYEDVTSFPATDEFKDDIACVLARFR